MERIGVRVDAAALRQQSGELAQRLWELEQQAHALAGERFNLGSPKQLQMILFERLGLPAGKKTATGQISTAEDVLQELALDYPLPRVILEHRTLSKLKSTYTDRLPGADSSPHRPGAYLLSSSGGQHRSAVLIRSQFAEHPHHAPRKAGASARRLCAGTGLGDAGGGLFADRTANHGPSVRR
jgi:hypothetical protein